jgi:hypothetical protein
VSGARIWGINGARPARPEKIQTKKSPRAHCLGLKGESLGLSVDCESVMKPKIWINLFKLQIDLLGFSMFDTIDCEDTYFFIEVFPVYVFVCVHAKHFE